MATMTRRLRAMKAATSRAAASSRGIYGGMIVGLFVQTLILVYVTFRTDWNREVGEAKKRLNKWGDIAKPLLANED
ncbi:hypothetical protein OsI_12316 [Oryza sativa Indica Group]|uniref:Protein DETOXIFICATION n=1 Tax=Oryza sativa subsp. indica TaxID=39946 RepID=A2XIQ8_ORYSI|nr:hypothetical protein OsI_12316 [Oryza sativa Indica Group]